MAGGMGCCRSCWCSWPSRFYLLILRAHEVDELETEAVVVPRPHLCHQDGVPWRRVFGWLGLLVVAAVVVVAGIYVVVWPISDLIARHDVGAITGPHRAAALQACAVPKLAHRL